VGIAVGFASGGAHGVTTFAGNVVNSGSINAKTGIGVFGSTISGAIVDSGAIKATSIGILVSSGGVISGGIRVSSKGTVSARSGSGIAVQNTTTFGGGITNSGTISSGAAGIIAFAVSTFAGGITNSGAISGGSVLVFQLSSFGGGISNSGKITGLFNGIRVNCRRN
jgi:hypothetical protein